MHPKEIQYRGPFLVIFKTVRKRYHVLDMQRVTCVTGVITYLQ